MISLKSESEIALMRACGGILARILEEIRDFITAGITTADIDRLAHTLITAEGVGEAFKGYRGFPATACVSVNEEIVHGIPGERMLEDGDIVSVDLGISYRGFFADAAFTAGIGRVNAEKKNLISVTREALEHGIEQARPGNRLYDISYAIQAHVEQFGFSVVRQFVGHGIGASLHEEPEVPNYGKAHQGIVLKQGMVLAIEPMVNCGSWEAKILENGWTAVTVDQRPSAHFEHTVAITGDGPSILTR